MTIAAKLLTADDLWAMPGNGDGYELVLGELRSMPPSGQQHSSIGVIIIAALQVFVKAHKLGLVTGPDGGYILRRNPDTVRAPDVAFVSADRLPNGRPAQRWFPGHPDFAVEIISPTDVYGDVNEKVQEFLDAGTRLVWVVNPRHKTVTILRNDNTITALGPTDTLSGESVLPGFKITVAEIFRVNSVLFLDHIHFSRPLGDAFRPILCDISFTVAPGQIAAILGANGSGKSTLLRLAVGYLWPQRGSIQLLGHTLGNVPLADLRKRIGLVEAVSVYPFDETMSARDVVVSGYFAALTIGYIDPTPDQWAHADHLLDQVGLTAQRDQLYHTLSTGQRMRALVARALVRRPELLILDEPTSGLDLPSRESVLATVTRLWESATPKPAIITVTHHLEELLPTTSAILLLSQNGATVASGTPSEVLTPAHLTEAYGVPIDVQQRNGRWWASVNPTVWPTLLE